MKRRSITMSVSALALWTAAFLALSVVPGQAGPLDDFMCYKAKDLNKPPQAPGLQLLEDPLFEPGQIPFLVKKAKEFCVPASKVDPALINPDVQLKRYRIKRGDGLKHVPQTVTVGDQFTPLVGGKLVLITKKARDLMVPSAQSLCAPGSPQNAGESCTKQKDCGGDDFCKGDPPKCSGNAPVNPGGACTVEEDCGGVTYCPTPAAPDPLAHDVDHFKCYRIKVDKLSGPAFPKGIVTPVYDQFDSTGARQIPVKKPFELCNPVDKNGEGIKDPARRLLCYKVKPVTDQKAAQAVNQFGIEQLDLGKEKLLCVPASPSGAFLDVTSGMLD